ncbi:MAG: HD domain-containing protein [Campylobacterales bacterium]
MIRRYQLALEDRSAWLEEEVRKATAMLREREREIIIRLSKAAEYRDPETGAHLIRMAEYSRLITKELGKDGSFCDMLLEAAPMHDIGKVGIPDAILLKPGKLDDSEFELMKRHAQIGYEILSDSPSELLKFAAEIALYHHERFDGKGYPTGLSGTDIPLAARIVAVADVFDALTSERPYKKAWPFDEAFALIERERGHHFDPACVDAFLANKDKIHLIHDTFSDHHLPIS